MEQTPQQPPTIPPYQSKLPLIISLIILVLIAGGSILFLSQKTVKINISPTPIPTQSVTIGKTDNWKTYTNDKYGYSFKYPSNFILTDRPDNLILSADDKSNIIMTCNKFIFALDYIKANLQITPEFYTFKVGNRNGKRLDKTVMLEGNKCVNSVIIIRTPDRTDIKSIDISLSRQEKEFPKLFDQILSTLKFTN